MNATNAVHRWYASVAGDLSDSEAVAAAVRELGPVKDGVLDHDVRTGYSTRHIDQLLPGIGRGAWVDESIRAFVVLCDLCVRAPGLWPSLAITLECSERLITSPPSWQEPPDRPPALYLDRYGDRPPRARDIEQYRVPVTKPEALMARNDISAEYQCWRDRESIEHDWEYCRVLQLDYWGPTDT